MTRLELLAPARTADIGIAAIRCGADAVYLGGPQFGARAAAGNSIEDRKRLCRFAAIFKARVLVTVNTLARDEKEREEMAGMIVGMKDIGISAFILQDTTLAPLLSGHGPWKEEFHASTQCTILTPERAVQLASMGFSRLVLERQLSLEQIRRIRKAVPENVELEGFVHGAVCVCYSGECYLSESLTGRSANRGECAQPCRNNWDLFSPDGKVIDRNRPLLSLKDLNLLDRLSSLADAGIVSFKIEGRLKNASYVKNITRAYDIALNKLVENSGGKYGRVSLGRVIGGFAPDVLKTFNRSYTELFLMGKKDDWMSGAAAKGMGEEVGEVVLWDSSSGRKKRVFNPDSLKISGLHNGDGLCFIGNDGKVNGLRAERVEGDIVYPSSLKGLKNGMKLWRNYDAAFERELEHNMPQRILDVNVNIRLDSTAFYAATGCCRVSEQLPSNSVPAENQERMQAVILSQMSKTSGNYRFNVTGISHDGPLPLLAASYINGIRRKLAEQIQESSCFDTCNGIADRVDDGAEDCAANRRHSGIKAISLPHKNPGNILLRSKYCLLHQLGLCPRTQGGETSLAAGGLILSNGGRKFKTVFDCRNCEMMILDDRDLPAVTEPSCTGIPRNGI